MTRSLSHYHLLSKQIFQVFSIAAVLLFLSRLCKKKFPVIRLRFCQQIPSADFCIQQIFFLSSDSISKFCRQQICFLSSNVYADVMEMTLTPAYSVSRQPVSCRKSFRLRPARIFASITIPFVLPDLSVVLVFVYNTVRSMFKHQTHHMSAHHLNGKRHQRQLNIIMTADKVCSLHTFLDARV